MALIDGPFGLAMGENKNRQCVVKWDNKTFEVDVTEINIGYDYQDDYSFANHQGSTVGYVNQSAVTVIKGMLREINIQKNEETDMGRYDNDCDKACEGVASSALVKQVVDLDMEYNKRKMLEHRIVNQDGTVTYQGIELVVQLWLQDPANVEKVVEKLDAVDAAQKAKKSK